MTVRCDLDVRRGTAACPLGLVATPPSRTPSVPCHYKRLGFHACKRADILQVDRHGARPTRAGRWEGWATSFPQGASYER